MFSIIHNPFTISAMTTNEEFGRWLEERLAERGIKKYVEVEERSNGEIDGPLVGLWVRGEKKIGEENARRLARALGMRQVDVFYAAGILTEKPGDPVFADPLKADVWRMIDRMGSEELMGIKLLAEMVLSRGRNEPGRSTTRNR